MSRKTKRTEEEGSQLMATDQSCRNGHWTIYATDTQPSAEPLVSVRGKAKLVPASSLPKPFPLPSWLLCRRQWQRSLSFAHPNPHSSQLVPMQPGQQRYEVDDSEVRVSYNDQRLGEEKAVGVSEELDVRRKGEAIIDRTEPTTADTTPHLYTRQLPSGKLVVYVQSTQRVAAQPPLTSYRFV